MKIEIKSYKSCRGNEGDAFSCTLYLDGQKAALVKYDGWGGGYLYDWSATKGNSKRFGGPLHDAFKAYVDSLPEVETSLPDHKDPSKNWMMKPSMDTVVGDAIQDMLETRQYKRWCKKKTVFRLKDQKKGEVMTMDISYSPAVKLRLERQHGEALVEIINERFVA